MNTKHTPGPWGISRDAVPKGHVQSTVYAEHSGQRVATVFESEANVHLVAAAPELLEACKKALTCGLDSSVRALVVAAITKAEGQ